MSSGNLQQRKNSINSTFLKKALNPLYKHSLSHLTLGAAPWAGLFGRAGGRSLVQSSKFKDQSDNTARLPGQSVNFRPGRCAFVKCGNKFFLNKL
jgi:hypothetical protein